MFRVGLTVVFGGSIRLAPALLTGVLGRHPRRITLATPIKTLMEWQTVSAGKHASRFRLRPTDVHSSRLGWINANCTVHIQRSTVHNIVGIIVLDWPAVAVLGFTLGGSGVATIAAGGPDT